jgi:hypothetical protein
MQTLVKRRDVSGIKDAEWFLTARYGGFEIFRHGQPTLSAYREGLRYRVSPAEQGKPVFLLFEERSPQGGSMEVRATEEGESEGRSVIGRILVAPARPATSPDCESRQTSFWSFSRENLSNRLTRQSR